MIVPGCLTTDRFGFEEDSRLAGSDNEQSFVVRERVVWIGASGFDVRGNHYPSGVQSLVF